MKMYGELLKEDGQWAERAARFSAKVRDVTETLASLPPQAVRRTIASRVAYHDACHLAHAQGVRHQPREVLAAIPGLTLVPLAEPDICCGSAGIFNLVEPEMAAALGQRKAEHIAAATPDIVVTSNPGCMLQMRAALRTVAGSPKVMHIMELVDRSIA
jgi:glycolate oxidase iron-sulfur subunit